MNSLNMKNLKPYKAITKSSDGTIQIGQIMWVSENGFLNLPDKCGGGFLLEEEWKSPKTCNFEAEEAVNFEVIKISGCESLQKIKKN